MSDDEIWALNRGGHDPHKVYAAYAAAVEHTGQPTVILAKTIKGYGMGEAGEGQNITHQQKKMNEDALLAFRDRFELAAHRRAGRATSPFYKPADDSPGDAVPARAPRGARRLACRSAAPTRRAARRCRSSTAFEAPARGHRRARDLDDDGVRPDPRRRCCATSSIGKHVVPIVPDESRTFGMEGMFRQLGIFSQVGQLYEPEDAEQLMFYKEDKNGPDPAGGHQRGRARSRRGSPRRRRTPTTACR